jgi:RNA-dependent RNA polymerase
MIRESLCDHNIVFTQPEVFKLLPKKENTFWNHISETSVSWALRYQLDVCISQSILLEENICEDFIKALLQMPEREAVQRLEYAVAKKDRLFDPTTLLGVHVPYRSMAHTKIPAHCILSRSANITPSTIYFSSPAVEMSNRILRQYKDHADRFLRVRFSDEKHEGRIQSVDDESANAIFNRVFSCMFNGINIGGRHYEFLAMGNSQFREHGAYFFASQPGLITASQIRASMGDFSHIKVVAKWASRLGQCFSTTRAIRGTNVKIIEIDDIERETYIFVEGRRKKASYNFTDGVGKMSQEVASIVAGEMGIVSKIGEPPSVFQVRLGGIKGVLAINPGSKAHEVHIRPSQYKFPAVHEGLEIIRYSSFSSVVLNRQLITVLSALQVPPGVFLKKMREELYELQQAMSDSDIALSKLQHRIDFNQMTLTLAETVADGFLDADEPFITSCLRLWRVWYHKSLKDKAGLTIGKGAFVLGCVDETASLRGYTHKAMHDGLKTREQKTTALPQIFIQVDPLRTGAYKVIKGICLVARNPSLHPGDIRVVEAIDVPALHHLRDVVVFSQLGERDVPSMCSGGDLDGDDFVVIWDEALIPPETNWDVPAMDFTGPSPLKVNRQVEITDVIPFFVQYMKTDKLRSIAISHIANADFLVGGIRHPRCLELAELHSIAVDYPKSGVPALMKQDLRPFKYPHFMPSKFRAADRLYRSDSVLGKLYDMVDTLDFEPVHDKPFDERILNAYTDIDEEVFAKAREIKEEYDAGVRRVMAQQEIATEFEVWTTFVLDHARIISDYKFHEEIGALASMLRERFQETVLESITELLKKAGKDTDISKDGPEVLKFVVAMYKITAEEVKKWQVQKAQIQDIKERASLVPPLISYPWLFQRELCKIASLNAKPKRVADPALRQTGKNIWKSSTIKNAWRNDVKTAPTSLTSDVVMEDADPTILPTPPAPVLIDFSAEDDMEVDDIETAAGGVKHRGDMLELFQGMYDPSPDISRPQSTVHGDVDMEHHRGEELTDGLDEEFDTLLGGDGMGVHSKGEKLADRELTSAWSLRSQTQEADIDDDDEDGNGEIIMGMDEDDEMTAKIERLKRMGA